MNGPDIVLSSAPGLGGNIRVAIYKNDDGQGDFGPPATFTTPGDAVAMDLGDTDFDRDNDFVVSDFPSQFARVFSNVNGTFPSSRAFPPGGIGGQAFSVVLGDLDEDGAPEIVTCVETAQLAIVLINDGGGDYNEGPVAPGWWQRVSSRRRRRGGPG